MSKFKLSLAIGACVLITAGAIYLILANNKKDLTISLDSNPSTGYTWVYSVSESEVVKISEDYENKCDAEMVGCGGKSIFTIKPLKQGKTTITFTYSRSWEEDANPKTAIYEINVSDNLKITEKHSGSYFEE